MLRLKNISFSYNNNDNQSHASVFKSFSLDIRKGERLTLLGKSGCGKTTLINLVAGYLTPGTGTIKINGLPKSSPGRDRIVINQEDDLFGWMTVRQNVNIVARDKSQKSVFSFLRLAGLESFADLYPHQLSGGMKKRLSLVRALSAEPNFLILDEPFGSLDHSTAEKIQSELAGIVEQSSITTLLVTHNLDEAILLSDRIIILSGNPAQKKAEIAVSLPSPKRCEARKTKEFASLKRRIQSLLSE